MTFATRLKYWSVCSGIEAATVAWHEFMDPVAFVERDAFPSAVLAHHYSGVPNFGDMTKWREWPKDLMAEADVLVGGTPCQAFSVAGLRKSLDDDRGNLSLEFVRLADAIDDLRHAAGKQPTIILWENVPGVLSVKDNAFGCFISALAGEDTPLVPTGGRWTDAGVVIGPERAIAWRILDAQYFGVAQRRRRVFVCGVSVRHPRARDIATSLFPVSQSVSRHPPSRAKTREVAPTIPSRSTAGGGLGTDFDLDGAVIQASTGDISHCLNAGGMGRQDYETETLVAHTLKGEGFDASEDGTGRGTPLVPVAYAFQPRIARNGRGDMGDIVNALNAQSGETGKGDAAPCVAYGISNQPTPKFGEEICPSLDAKTSGGGRMEAVAYAQSGETGKGDAAPCVAVADTLSVGANQTTGFHTEVTAVNHMAVRRLTPVECERLQGFPDNYTAIPWRGKPADQCPDGHRYKALGNSMAVPVMRWIGQRIIKEINRED